MVAVEGGAERGALVRYRNREIGEAELSFLRGCVERAEGRSLRELSREICRAWEWRQRNGALSEYACRDLLLRLEEWGHLRLPASRRRSAVVRQRLSKVPLELIVIPEVEVREGWADLKRLVVRPIEPEERVGWRVYVERYHYLGWRPVVGEHVLYAAEIDGELVALLGWASAALRLTARECYIGWDDHARRARLHLVANNVRFLVLPWVQVHNLASRVLALNLRRLSADWQQRWGHPIHLAETFIDSARFRASSYRAANWRYVGESAGRSRKGNRYLFHSSPKAVYLYELHRHARALLRG
jgi:hypothetical protein